MVNITKNMSNEPDSLREFRLRTEIKEKLRQNTNGMYARYIDEFDATELREVLKQEQGAICCYCMSSIENSKTKIEHFKSRSENANLEVEYKNLYLSCDGEKVNCTESQNDLSVHNDCKCKDKREEDKKRILKHCDTCKGDRTLEYIKLNDIERNIKYKSDGTIFSNDVNIDAELNNVLNLNASILMENRSEAKNNLYDSLPKNGSWNKDMITKLIEKYTTQSKKAPYLGVLLYFLKKQLSK